MLRKLRGIVTLSAACLLTLTPAAPSRSQDLTAALQDAVCAQNWELALQIVDQVLRSPAIAPLQRAELTSYRGRLHSLLATKAKVPGGVPNCGTTTATTPTGAIAALPMNPAADQELVANYKRMLKDYPEVSELLLSQASQSPGTIVSEAKNVCQALQSGQSIDTYYQGQARAAVDQRQVRLISVNAAIFKTLAPQYYCPAFSRRR